MDEGGRKPPFFICRDGAFVVRLRTAKGFWPSKVLGSLRVDWMLMPYRRYFDFRGRSRRREYWLFGLFYMLVSMAVVAVFGAPSTAYFSTRFRYETLTTGTAQLVLNLFGLVSFIPSLAVSVRRLHDIDRSGWWLLLWLVPVLGWIVLFVFICLDGTYGRNRYGYDPKGRGTADIFR